MVETLNGETDAREEEVHGEVEERWEEVDWVPGTSQSFPTCQEGEWEEGLEFIFDRFCDRVRGDELCAYSLSPAPAVLGAPPPYRSINMDIAKYRVCSVSKPSTCSSLMDGRVHR